MMKKDFGIMVVLMAALVLIMPTLAVPALAENDSAVGVVDAGNKLCPVSGNLVSGKDFVTCQGKRYGLCCPKCMSPFLNDPEKYTDRMVSKTKQASAKTL